MNLIPLEKVIIPDNRIRREFPEEAMNELADSIKRLGLLQPIVLADDNRTLIAGERRLRACTALIAEYANLPEPVKAGDIWHPSTTRWAADKNIPYVSHSDLDDISRLEAELEENTRRLDLTWQERARADAALHKLRVSQHGEYAPGTKAAPGEEREKKGWTLKDTAKEIVGRTPTSHETQQVRDAVLLAEFLDDPLVAAAPDEKSALKVLRNLKKEQERARLAKEWTPASSRHKLNLGDAYTFLAELPEGFADCGIFDPPYGRNMQTHSFEKKHKYDDTPATFHRFCSEAPKLIHRAAKAKFHGYVFCDHRYFNDLFVAFEVAGFTCWPWPLIWDKGNVGTFGNADQGPRHCYDCILYINKGRRPCIAMYSDVIPINQEQHLAHPAGKPAALLHNLLKRTVNAGDVVIDPMVGGGTFFQACHQAKVTGVANEGDETYYNMAIEILKELEK